ncbi:MAG: hypothetical protein GXO90_01170, partial [FCB group bacterium]|nr:hypothetical protein [FCB group bacterium]
MSAVKKLSSKTHNGSRKRLTVIVIVSVLALLIILIGVREYFKYDAEKRSETASEAPSEKLIALRNHEQEILTTYGLSDENGYYRI